MMLAAMSGLGLGGPLADRLSQTLGEAVVKSDQLAAQQAYCASLPGGCLTEADYGWAEDSAEEYCRSLPGGCLSEADFWSTKLKQPCVQKLVGKGICDLYLYAAAAGLILAAMLGRRR